MADRLTIKQRKWLKVYIETGNATEAAMQAYNCKKRDTARALGAENLAKLSGPVSEILDMAGLTNGKLMDSIADGVGAMKTEIAKFQGKIGGEKDYIDYPTRKGYIEIALNLKGLLRADGDIAPPDVNINLNPKYVPAQPTGTE